MKKRIAALSISLALTVGLCVPSHAAEMPFTDVPTNHWAAESIAEMSEAGVMTGIGNSQFAPDKTITYAEFITMLVRQFFPNHIVDVDGPWYAPYVEGAKTVGHYYLDGILYDTEIASNPAVAEIPIDRYTMALLCYRTMTELPKYVPLTNSYEFEQSHPDIEKDIYKIKACYDHGILTGVDSSGAFHGEGVMTRAQAAVVMSRLIDYEKDVYSYLSVQPPADLPSNATHITSVEQCLTSTGGQDCEGGIHLHPDYVLYGSGGLGIDSTGFDTVTFTITAADVDTRISYRIAYTTDKYTDPMHLVDTVVVKAGESKTFTYNCSDSTAVGISATDNNHEMDGIFAECWYTNIYFY